MKKKFNRLKIKMWDENGAIFKQEGNKDIIKKELEDFFKFKL